eukprot:1431859-Rhodomonas_salina.1
MVRAASSAQVLTWSVAPATLQSAGSSRRGRRRFSLEDSQRRGRRKEEEGMERTGGLRRFERR